MKTPVTISNLTLVSLNGIEIVCSQLKLNQGDDATLILNSKDIIISKDKVTNLAVENMIPVRIYNIFKTNNKTVIKTNLNDQSLSIDIPEHTSNTLNLNTGMQIYLAIKASNINLYPQNTAT